MALLSALLFGASTPIGKVLLESLPPFQLAGWLYFGAAIGVAPGVFLKSDKPLSIGRMGVLNFGRLSGAIAFGGIAGPVLLLMGLQRSSAASVAMWLNLELAATALLGVLIFKDHLGRSGWIGVAGTFLASLMLSGQGGGVGRTALLLVACACICWGMDNHLTALIDGITPRQSTFWKGIVAGGVNLSIGLSIEPHGVEAAMAAIAMGVGVFAYGFSISLYIMAAQHLGATRSQMIFSSAPFFGVALAVLFLEESISPVQAIAAVLLIASLILLFRDRHEHLHQHKPTRHRHEHNHDDPHHEHGHAETGAGAGHDHDHHHPPLVHGHPHWPDIHHRHKH